MSNISKIIHGTSTETEIANKKSHDSFQVIRLSMTSDLGDISRSLLIKLFHIKFLVNGAWYGKGLLLSTNRKSYTSFRLGPLLMTLKDI